MHDLTRSLWLWTICRQMVIYPETQFDFQAGSHLTCTVSAKTLLLYVALLATIPGSSWSRGHFSTANSAYYDNLDLAQVEVTK